jgi:hypothetical protein
MAPLGPIWAGGTSGVGRLNDACRPGIHGPMTRPTAGGEVRQLSSLTAVLQASSGPEGAMVDRGTYPSTVPAPVTGYCIPCVYSRRAPVQNTDAVLKMESPADGRAHIESKLADSTATEWWLYTEYSYLRSCRAAGILWRILATGARSRTGASTPVRKRSPDYCIGNRAFSLFSQPVVSSMI